MEPKKQPGFSLFPQPPTPPARRGRARTRSSSDGSSKLVKTKSSLDSSHGRKASTSRFDPSEQPGLIPAPLQVQKPCSSIPPVPSARPVPPPCTPKRSKKEHSPPPKTPESAPPQLPLLPQSSPFSPLPRSLGRSGHFRAKTRIIAEHIELEAGPRKRSSSRLSQWLDLEDGEIDQRRLSRYLGSVLDNTFEVPIFESRPNASVTPRRKISKHELSAVNERCACPADAIICHCSSSPEFERFRSWSHHHKQSSSISSTACLLGVPRARFQMAFFQAPEPSVAELPSPPGLAFDTEDNASDAEDWSTPLTPSKEDVFSSPPTTRSKPCSSKQTLSPTSTSSISAQSRFQSFSRPFRPDSTYRLASTDSSTPSTPSRAQSRSTNPKPGFLTSISTVSSFDFDFDFQARRRSLLQLESLHLQSLPQFRADRESCTHLRTGSSETVASQASRLSQYEVSTATATVAMSGSSIKPVLVTKKAKRAKPSASTSTSTSTSSSAQSASSSFSVPEYWRHYDAGLRVRSRSTTVCTTATDESAALSALLSIPVLSPRNITPASAIVTGNAFAQRSTTAGALPSVARQGRLSRDVDSQTTDSDPAETLNRSHTTTAALPASAELTTNDHVQAYANVQARLQAYMNGGPDTVRARSAVGEIRMDSAVQGDNTCSQHYLREHDEFIDRGDSGVFGRWNNVGVSMGGYGRATKP